MSGVASRAGMPWYQSPNDGRMATIKNNCNLFIEVKRLGASGTAHFCESDSDFSNPLDSIFHALRGLRQLWPALKRRPRRTRADVMAAFVTGISGYARESRPDHETSLTPADLSPQVGEGPIGPGASDPWTTVGTLRWIPGSPYGPSLVWHHFAS